MADLIDRDALKQEFCDFCVAMDSNMQECMDERLQHGRGRECMSLRIISEQPAIEAEPARHCRMIPQGVDCRGYTSMFRCTGCETDIITDQPRKEYDEWFCPHCGAKVDDGV